MRKLYGLLSFLFLVQIGWAQVSITTVGAAYTQDFNTLATSGTNNAWTDNTTIAGWYSNRTVYIADNGGSTTGGLFSYGTTSTTERALGALTSGSANPVQFGVRLVNNTGAPITSLTISFTGEQWRQTANAQLLVFDYQVGATTLTTGTWTPATAFDFTAPKTGTAGSLDGNLAANQTAVNGTLTVSVAAGQEVWLRWTKSGTTSPGLAIDNVSITANAGAITAITTGIVSTPPFCVDATTSAAGTVAYTATGAYNTTFTAFLSNASGSFAAPVSVGTATVNGTNPSGTINISIPAGTVSGTGYRIRVDAGSPAVTGTSSTAFEIVNGATNVSGSSVATGNAQATVSWTNPTACFDEILIVAKASAAVTGTPSGDGSAYTASLVYGNGTAFDGGFVVYKGTSSPQTVTGLTNGTIYYFKIFTRKGTNWSSGAEVSATPSSQVGPGDIVINQLSPDYGTSATDEYIELLNKTNSPINLSNFAIKYQSSAGNSGAAGGTLSGILPARSYWLLSPNATVTVGLTNNLAADGSITAGMASASGQVALVRLTSGADVIIDAVGYGSTTINPTSPYTETAAAPQPPTDGGLRRSTNGADNNNNSTDFVTVANANIFLRSSAAGSPLAVKFSNLKAVQRGNGVLIGWSNLTELGVTEYAIERSSDGANFTNLLKISPRQNLGGQADYSFIDASPARGINFYRIRSMETNGKISYSSILRLNGSNALPGLTFYPNPVKGSEGFLQLSNMTAGDYSLRIFSPDGRLISAKMMAVAEGSSTAPVLLNKLPPGVYTLQLSGPASFTQRFLRQ